MGTTKQDISEWFDQGISKDAAYMIIVCDTFDWEDYPVFVKQGVDLESEVAKYDGRNMQKVMEVYDLAEDRIPQLNAHRAWVNLT